MMALVLDFFPDHTNLGSQRHAGCFALLAESVLKVVVKKSMSPSNASPLRTHLVLTNCQVVLHVIKYK